VVIEYTVGVETALASL